MRISDWSSDVCSSDLAGVLEPIGQATADLVAGCPGQADAAGLGQALQAGRDVDAVAVDIVVLVDDVAEVDADAEADALGLRSEERRVGKECVSTCRSRCTTYP